MNQKDSKVTERRLPPGLIIAFISLVYLAQGCTLNCYPYVTKTRLQKGLVIILPGIEGPGVYNVNIREGLYAARLPYAMEIHNWIATGRVGAAYAFDQPACRKSADKIYARIADYRTEHPDSPVFIIGHSGGGAIAVFTTEAVPAEEPVDGVLLLAPALSTTYKLDSSLPRCRGHLVNCYTPTDLFLASATRLGRNLDGIAGASAGYSGFKMPEDSCNEGLKQIKWSASMILEGNEGGHFGWTNPNWVRLNLAPIITGWAKQRDVGQEAKEAVKNNPTEER